MAAIEARNMKKDCWYMMAHALLQAMSPEPAAMMEPPEVQEDPSSSSPSQPQENASQSPVAVQAGTSTATGHAARYVTWPLHCLLLFHISSMRNRAVWPHTHIANALGCYRNLPLMTCALFGFGNTAANKDEFL